MIEFTTEEMFILKRGKKPWPSMGEPERGWQQISRVEYIPSDCVNTNCNPIFLEGCYEVTKNGGGRIMTIPIGHEDLLGRVIQAIAGPSGEKFWLDLYSEEETMRKEYAERSKYQRKQKASGFSDLNIDDLLS